MAVTGPGTVILDTRGNIQGRKATYSAASASFAAAASTSPFWIMEGSATKTIRIQRIRVTGPTLTAVAYQVVVVEKYSSASSGGTPVALTAVPHDSTSDAATPNLNSYFTAAPTGGSKVGIMGARRILGQATTAAAAGQPVDQALEWNWDGNSMEQPVLRGVAQGIGLAFLGAPGSAITLTIEVTWTEE